MPSLAIDHSRIPIEYNDPDTWLNALPAYNLNEGVDLQLDLLRRLAVSTDYFWRVISVPKSDSMNIGAFQGFESGIILPPETYIVSLSGYSSDAAGFMFAISDKGSKVQMMEKAFIHSSVILGRESKEDGTIGFDEPFGPFLIPSPFCVLKPGQLQIQITNLASVAANIQVTLGCAVPVTAQNIGVVAIS